METSTTPLYLLINLSVDTGPVKHGAAGFLYGLGNDGIPSVNVLAPLKPQVAAQKAEGGLQHPNGDALQVSDTYRSAGGREIEIYLQDLYTSWPYEQLGLPDYLVKVETAVREVAAHPNHDLFSFVPLNEPDQIWYNLNDKRQALLDDWQQLFALIKSIHPAARIVGPNFARYDSAFYREFIAFARERACLPDVISWHELNGDFFSGWEARLADYRAIERELGVAPREICINEYVPIKGDLGNPGKLIQWVARLEAGKVDACLAYWTDAGSLNNLVTRDHYNRATGAWWLYQSYAGLTGHTVEVVSPNPLSEGLHGLAALDPALCQARILFGGSPGELELVVNGLEALPGCTQSAHAVLWAIDSTSLAASTGPRCLMEDIVLVRDGSINLTLDSLDPLSAYLLILTPPCAETSAATPGRYPAVFAGLSGAAAPVYEPEGAWVELGSGSGASGIDFVVTAEDNAFHTLRLHLKDPAPAAGVVQLRVNGRPAAQLRPGQLDMCLFLERGINRITFESTPAAPAAVLRLEAIQVAPQPGGLLFIAAAAPDNTLGGTAAVIEDPAAPCGSYVGQVGGGAENFVQFNRVSVTAAGAYHMVVYFANAEFRGGHSYNSQVVDRFAEIRVNNGPTKKVYFRNTFAWDNYQSRVVDVELRAGENTIRFANHTPSAFAPHLNRIALAPAAVEVIQV